MSSRDVTGGGCSPSTEATQQMPESTTLHIHDVHDALVAHVAHRSMLTTAFERWGDNLEKALEQADDPALKRGQRGGALTSAIRETGC